MEVLRTCPEPSELQKHLLEVLITGRVGLFQLQTFSLTCHGFGMAGPTWPGLPQAHTVAHAHIEFQVPSYTKYKAGPALEATWL